MVAPTPITILTGFLGSGKTTLILNLIPQLPPTYKLALLKNEFGDVAVDSQLASAQAISGVKELLGGCICCNLVGQLGVALEQLRDEIAPDRIIIETSGSAFPATLAMEVNRIIKESNDEKYVLDGVISVIDVENWQGYEDTSVTAKLQAAFTDLVVFNKWELVDERKFDTALDRLGDLELQTPYVKSDKGRVEKSVILGIDGAQAREMKDENTHAHSHGSHDHSHDSDHQSEVEVLSVTLKGPAASGVDLEKLEYFLLSPPKDEIYRIKGFFYSSTPPADSTGRRAGEASPDGKLTRYILNWAFSRWTFTPVPTTLAGFADDEGEPIVRATIICAKYSSSKWSNRIRNDDLLNLEGPAAGKGELVIERIS